MRRGRKKERIRPVVTRNSRGRVFEIESTGYVDDVSGALIMGRDPVERAKRAKYQPPAMRVRGVCYTKKSPFHL